MFTARYGLHVLDVLRLIFVFKGLIVPIIHVHLKSASFKNDLLGSQRRFSLQFIGPMTGAEYIWPVAATWCIRGPLNGAAQVLWSDHYDILTWQLLEKNKKLSPTAIMNRHYCKLWPCAFTSGLVPCLWRNLAVMQSDELEKYLFTTIFRTEIKSFRNILIAMFRKKANLIILQTNINFSQY